MSELAMRLARPRMAMLALFVLTSLAAASCSGKSDDRTAGTSSGTNSAVTTTSFKPLEAFSPETPCVALDDNALSGLFDRKFVSREVVRDTASSGCRLLDSSGAELTWNVSDSPGDYQALVTREGNGAGCTEVEVDNPTPQFEMRALKCPKLA